MHEDTFLRRGQDAKGLLFRTARDRSGLALTGNALWQQGAYLMMQRRAIVCVRAHVIAAPVIEAGGAGAFMRRHALRDFERAAVLQVRP